MLPFKEYQKSVVYGTSAERADSVDAINYGLFWLREHARWCNEESGPQAGDFVRVDGALRSIGCVYSVGKFQLGELSFYLYESGNLSGSGSYDSECFDLDCLKDTNRRAEQSCWIFSLGGVGYARSVASSISVRIWEFVSK